MDPKEIGRNLISYLSGTVVEKRTSAVSGELEVWYQSGKYVLHSPDANYSFDTLHSVFQKTFKKLGVKKRNPKSVLILGFGAGSVAAILCDELKLTPQITGVELDPEVIALARKYFNLDRYHHLEMHFEDAVEYVKACTKTFDLVVSDVFIDKTIPENVMTVEYLSSLLRITTKGGLGMMNVILESKEQRTRLEKIRTETGTIEAKTTVLQVSPINHILYWNA